MAGGGGGRQCSRVGRPLPPPLAPGAARGGGGGGAVLRLVSAPAAPEPGVALSPLYFLFVLGLQRESSAGTASSSYFADLWMVGLPVFPPRRILGPKVCSRGQLSVSEPSQLTGLLANRSMD